MRIEPAYNYFIRSDWRGGRPEITMFTTDNTEGYTTEQLAALNAELAQRLDGLTGDERAAAEKAFADEVAAR